jgi:hypothetical protein
VDIKKELKNMFNEIFGFASILIKELIKDSKESLKETESIFSDSYKKKRNKSLTITQDEYEQYMLHELEENEEKK